MRICNVAGCPTPTTAGKCTDHRRAAEARRGTRQQRGYDAQHDRLRAQWAPLVAQGNVTCWRCTQRILPTDTWDLGHDDNDRTQYRGPEHANQCNRAAAGRRSH